MSGAPVDKKPRTRLSGRRPSSPPDQEGARPPRSSSGAPRTPVPHKPRRTHRRRRSRVALVLILILVLVLVAAPVVGLLVWAILPGPGAGKGVVKLRFERGEDANLVGEKLGERGLVDSPRLLTIYLRGFARGVVIAPGTHLLRYGLSPRELVQRLGRLPTRARVHVTLPEGFNHFQIAERLEQREICDAKELMALAKDPALLSALRVSGGSVEGYLFPSTYDFFVDSEPAVLIRQMVQESRKRLNRVDERLGGAAARLTAERGFGEHEILTLASLVEKEARVREEQPLIASVFYNRLDDPSFRPLRMLQSDATAIYGCRVSPELAQSCAGFRGKVTPEMLRDAANPYNTYRQPGLPKGPIANPGESAIEAVLAPAKTDYLFFVADGTGRHRFSRTFEEHRRAIPR